MTALPDSIIQNGLFCCWKYEERNERKTKVPYQPQTGLGAKSNDPSSFVPYKTAVQASGYDGIGIGIFNGICAIDLDNCVSDSGYYTQTAAEIVALMHSYTEYSPSGNGLHILFSAKRFQYDTKRFYIMNHQAAPDMAAVISLGVLATCLQGKYKIEGTPGYFEPLSLYTVVIAAPGERKSSVMRDMTTFLYEYEQEYNKAHSMEIRENHLQRESLERQISGLQKKLERKESREMELELQQLQEQLEETPELKPVRFFADDCSSEALTSLMASNNGVFSVISTEGGIFDIMAGRYSNKSNIDVWLKGHCGDAIYVDRMTREAECIMHPALSAILSIQPSVLDEIMSNTTMTGRGLIARFLYASPPSRIGSRVFRTQPIPPEVTAAYRSLIFRLMALPIDGDAHTVRLSEKAFDLMADYFQEHEKFLVGEGQAISDWASKYIGAVLRIAGLLHCADMEDDKAEVTASTMSKAIQIGKYFLAHSTYAYSMMGTDLAIQKAKFVLAKLKKKNVSAIKRSELFQMCRGKFFKKTEEIFPTLELLEGHGYIRLEEPERQSVGRPADVKIIVNPAA